MERATGIEPATSSLGMGTFTTVLSHEIVDRIAGLTQVPLAALCDKVSMLNHSRR
jgi:hypothetical protein